MFVPILLLLAARAPLTECPEEQRVVQSHVRYVFVSGHVPAFSDSDLPVLADEDLRKWRYVGSNVWRHKLSGPTIGRGYQPDHFILHVDQCHWLLVDRSRDDGAFSTVRVYTNRVDSDLPQRTARLLGLPLALAEDPRDGVATALASSTFVVFAGIHPSQRASLVETRCTADSIAPQFCGVTIKPVASRVFPITRLDLDAHSFRAWKITFGAPRRTGFLTKMVYEDYGHVIEGECLHLADFTLNLKTGAWVGDERPSCEGL